MHLPTTLFLLSTAITLPYQTLALPIAETEQHTPVIERRRATYSVVNVNGSGTTTATATATDTIVQTITMTDIVSTATTTTVDATTAISIHILYTNDYHPANNSFNNNTRLINNDELLFICIRCNFLFLHIQRVDTNHITILILHTYDDDTTAIIIFAVMGPIHGASTSEAHGANQLWVSELEVQKDRRREEYRSPKDVESPAHYKFIVSLLVLVLVAMVEVVEVVTEAAAGEGEAELVTEEIVEDDKAEVVVTEEEVVDEDEADELVVVTELPIVVKIEMEPARENVPFPV
ncbi:hypothetical protein ZTR_01073 [Talaromyces verruculosus]|nr:hypothetical protein ZTR_01073 [Talaromyces verruculosus]